MAKKVIPLHMIPDEASEYVEAGGQKYLQSNESFFTFYKRSKGEHSKFFIGLKDEKKIWGAKCPKCKLVRVPAFMLMCPECDFAELKYVEMPTTGVMNSTPPITYFGHSLFQHQVPFGRGRVILEGSETGLAMNVYTTKGVLTPKVFKKGTKVKVIFRDERLGKPTDIFAIPLSELPAKLQKQKVVMESELDWTSADEPRVPAATPKKKEALASLVKRFEKMAEEVKKSERAKKNLAEWHRVVNVKTDGGSFSFTIDNGKLSVSSKEAKKADFVMLAQDLSIFTKWMDLKEALTNAIIADQLWISKNQEFTTIFKLDRLPRSLKRTKK